MWAIQLHPPSSLVILYSTLFDVAVLVGAGLVAHAVDAGVRRARRRQAEPLDPPRHHGRKGTINI